MKQVEVRLQGLAPYSQSAMHETPKLNKETHEDFDARTWREKCTVDADGVVAIPAMAFKQALDKAAKVLGEQIPGKGKNTYTKHFKAGQGHGWRSLNRAAASGNGQGFHVLTPHRGVSPLNAAHRISPLRND